MSSGSEDGTKALPLRFVCEDCKLAGPAESFREVVMSVSWRHKYNRLDAFVKIFCPICKTLLSITFEYIPK